MASRQLRLVIAGVEGFAESQIKRLALNVRSHLTAETPRDTGWARNNWIPKIGPSADDPVGSPEDPGVAAAAARAGELDVVANYKLQRGIVTVSNGVPYIQKLNAGHSRQQPSGFVEREVARAVEQTR